ncbi:hypothetical protein HDU79_003101 [Rhizoclosmatium sp. JEL0117]|nr:hypothetical protein HDU79_003101 [Rhizoclosmatium sp. JEL0117]
MKANGSRNLTLFMTLTAFVLLAFLTNFLALDSKATKFDRKSSKMCFTIIDNRIKQEELDIARFTSPKQLQDFIAEELKKPWDQQQLLNQYWTLQLLLTKHYAIKHGYKVFVSNTATYAANLTALGQVHNWGRVHYLMDLMNRPDIGCDWFVYLDSDAYPWMKGHKVSLEEYFSVQQVAVESYNYKERHVYRQNNGKHYPWNEQKESFLIGLSGQWEPRMGWPGIFLGYEHRADYLCSGIFLIKNNDIGKRLMRDWMYGAEDFSDQEKEIHRDSGIHFTADQHALCGGVFQRYYNVSSVYTFREFQYHFEGAFRHVWGQFQKDRVPFMTAALKDLEIWPTG